MISTDLFNSTNNKVIKYVLPLILLLTILLFVQYPQDYDNKVFKMLWETGHFILFTGLIYIIAQHSFFNKYHFLTLFAATAVFCLLAGLITETIQYYIGRSFDINDIINDFIGGFTGLFLSQINKKQSLLKNLSFLAISAALTIIATQVLIKVTINEWNMRQDFPLINDFENHFELQRWNHIRSDISLSKQIKRHGDYSMKMDFFNKKTPRVYLEHFINNWQSYRYLLFSLYNEQKEPVEIIVKIYDKSHRDSGYKYNDRFNLKTKISPGWTDFKILIDDIESAPQSRQLNLQAIESFGIWVPTPGKSVSLYLDNLRLEN